MGTINVGSIPQLFLDDHVIEKLSNVKRQFHRPTREPTNPLIEANEPWEQHGNGVYLYGGTILYDDEDKIFKLWYRTSAVEKDPSGQKTHIEPEGSYKACYAISEDGIKWEKPNLGLHTYEGSTKNNILPPSTDGSGFIRRPNLIKDYEEPDPKRRYKMIYMDLIENDWGLSKGYSADGLNWEMNVGEPHRFEPGIAPNGIFFGWDPRKQFYAQFHRKSQATRIDVDGRFARRRVAIVRTISRDFDHWGDTKEVLRRPDTEPDNWSLAHGVDLAAILYTDDLYLGFIDTTYSYHVEDVPDEMWSSVYKSEFAEYRTEMVYSRDGDNWIRVSPHWEFMPKGLWGTWDRVMVGLSKPIVTDNEILFYYTGRNLSGNAQNPHHPQNKLMHQTIDGQQMGYAIGLSRMRRDGFVSIDGYDPTGTLTTKPMNFQGKKLLINARAPEEPFGTADSHSALKPRGKQVEWDPSKGPFGQLNVELLTKDGHPIDGFRACDFDTFTGDAIRHVATWGGKSDISALIGSTVRLKFYLANAALYSFNFVESSPAKTSMNLQAPGAKGHYKS